MIVCPIEEVPRDTSTSETGILQIINTELLDSKIFMKKEFINFKRRGQSTPTDSPWKRGAQVMSFENPNAE